MTTSLITITSGDLSADVSPIGAELHRLDDATGNALLWDGDPAWWASHAPMLFPIVGELSEGRFLHRGRSWNLQRHGFIRTTEFALVHRSAASVTLRLESNEATRAMWPFEFRLDITHTLTGSTLTTTAVVTNTGDETMPTAFGFHHAFRWPLPWGGPRDAHTIRFAQPEPAPIHRIDAAGLVRPEPLPTPVVGDVLHLDDELFRDGVLIFDRPGSRSLVYAGASGSRLRIDHPGMPHLGIWTKPGAGYVCIEPWQGYADPVGAPGEIAQKPGSIALAPGAQATFTMAVTLEFA